MYSVLLLMAVSGAPLAPGQQYREQWYGGGGIPHSHPYNEYFENRLNAVPGGTATLTYPSAAPSWAGPAPAGLVVRLPADARLTIDGDPTRSTGPTRRYVSPPLEPGTAFHYNLKAEVVRDGKKLTATRRVVVRAGQETDVTLVVPGQAVAGK
jgi:uncharacterized protein (TIGR03000 family)